MKYKKQIATGVLAFSFLISGSSIFAATPQDLGIKNVQKNQQRQNKKNVKIELKKQNTTVGAISALTSTGFTVNIKNLKTKSTASVDVKTDAETVYIKNGIKVAVSDLSVGQKVIVAGAFDKTTNTITAKTVRITAKPIVANKNKKGNS